MIRSFHILMILAALVHAEGNPRLSFALGVLAETRGHADEATRLFEKARLADPVALPLVRRAASQRMAIGDRSNAVKLYRDLAAARPDDLIVQLTYADFLDQQSRGDALALRLSEETLVSILAKFPGYPEIIRRLAQHARNSGNKPRQLELMEMLSKDDPASAMLYRSLSRGMFEKDNADALAKLDERLLDSFSAHPDEPGISRTASDHFRDTDRPDKAIEILERHIEAAPSSMELRTRLGILYFTAKRDNEGEATLKAVLEIDPQQALAHQSLAKFYRLRDKPDLARFHGGELLKIRGGSPADFVRLSDEWLAANDPKQARILLGKAIFDHPGNPDLAEKLAIATRRDPETRKQAGPLFRAAETAKPIDAKTDPAFLLESAEAMIDEGQGKAAEQRLRSAIRSYPAEAKKETAAALRRLASLWESEKRNEEAARALRQRADALDR
jgi:predicted Zn-dependent protease